ATRNVFFESIRKKFPEEYIKLQAMYKTGAASKEYKDHLYEMVNELRKQYGISSSYAKPMKEKMHRD
ncbi:MAG: radical SAM protein, partial [Chloroflexi bacterium]|nr:radical SAM protein [Chloroflexota bacterium]